MLQEAYIATIWTETGINPDCWHMEENWNRHVHRFCKGWGRGSLSHKIFTINIFFKKYKKRRRKRGNRISWTPLTVVVVVEVGGGAYTYNFPSFHFDLFYTSPKIWGMEEGGGLIIIQFSICRFEKEKVCRGTHHPSPTRTWEISIVQLQLL